MSARAADAPRWIPPSAADIRYAVEALDYPALTVDGRTIEGPAAWGEVLDCEPPPETCGRLWLALSGEDFDDIEGAPPPEVRRRREIRAEILTLAERAGWPRLSLVMDATSWGWFVEAAPGALLARARDALVRSRREGGE